MTKRNRIVEPGSAPESPEKRDVLRELSELRDALRRAGMVRGAKTCERAIKLIRASIAPSQILPSQAFVDRVTSSDADDDPTVIGTDLKPKP